MPIMDHFSLIAPYYDRAIPFQNAEPLLTHVSPEPGHRLLDVGGGTGRVAQGFVGRVAQVCVLDPSVGMLAQSRRKGICITQGESEWLPFGAEVFDRIIVIDAFHHLLDQKAAARELMRVLACGGRLVIEEPDIAHWGVRLVAVAEKLLLMRSHFCPPRAIQAVFQGLGARARVARQGHTAWVIVDKGWEMARTIGPRGDKG
ncbi:MAG: methyltransferase domain-containing protein [Anaerolineae bacterium]|nr:methyltransferase domain-containing protein [Anaerolineae bacterium]